MLRNPLMEKFRAEISSEDKVRMEESFAIADRIHFLLKKHSISQRQLAEKLQKRESEISKWLRGGHNFTIDTLTRINQVIGERVFLIPDTKEHDQYLLKTIVSRVLKHYVTKSTSFLTHGREVSTLHVCSTGVLCNMSGNERTLGKDFVPANLKATAFKSIENVVVI